MRYKIIPTVFSIKEENFHDRFSKLIKLSKDIQIDFMDGKFVHSTFMDFDIVPDLKKYKNNFEAHLMAFHPEKHIQILKKKGFKKVIFHYEAYHDDKKVISLARKIKRIKMKAFLALNPETKPFSIINIAKEFDGILFMGVHPGKEHQMFIYEILEHIRQLRHFNKHIDIQIDGGVNTSNLSYIKKAGANLFNTGSFVSENQNPRHALIMLNAALEH